MITVIAATFIVFGITFVVLAGLAGLAIANDWVQDRLSARRNRR